MPVTPTVVVEKNKQKRQLKRSSYQPSRDDIAATTFIDERIVPALASARAYHKQWFISAAFLAGYQFHKWSDYYGGLIYASNVPRWRVRQPFNKIIEYVETRQSTLMSFMPEMRVRPKRNDEDSIRSAMLGDNLLKSAWEEQNMDEIQHDFIRYLVTLGNGFLKVTWDADAGETVKIPMGDPRTGEQAYDKDYNPVFIEASEGNIRTEVISPHNIILPEVPRWGDVTWIGQQTERPLSWVGINYPMIYDYIGEADLNHGYADDKYERSLMNLVGPSGYKFGIQESDEGTVTVTEFWSLPDGDPDFPNGRKIVRIGSVIAENDENPYGDIPYVHVADILIPGRILGQGIPEHLIPEQKVLNRVIGKFVECLILHGQPKMTVPTLAGIPDSALTSEPDERLEYHGPTPPAYMNPPPFAQEAYNWALMRTMEAMDHTSISFSASRGMAQQSMSGIALAQIIERDVQDMTPVSKRLANGYKRWGSLVLRRYEQFVGTQRLMRWMGPNKRWEVQAWTGADIDGHHDVYVDPSSAVPKNKALALTWVKELVASGIKNPMDPQDRAWIHKFLQIEDTTLDQDMGEVDERLARQENQALQNGFPVRPALWHENHNMHIGIHRTAMQTDSFRDNPMILQMAEQHLQSHYMYLMPMMGQGSPQYEKPGQGGKRQDRSVKPGESNPSGAVPGAAPAPGPVGPMPTGPGASMDMFLGANE